MDQLIAMGFEETQVQEAWARCGGNAERAVEYLLGGGAAAGTDASTSTSISHAPAAAASSMSPSSATNSNSSMISCDISQYSVPEGRSACTCIALTGAALLLHPSSKKDVTADVLRQMVLKGVEHYQHLQKNNNNSSVEHLSAEEVLRHPDLPDDFRHLHLAGGAVRQGLLSRDASHPLGLTVLLEACRSEATTSGDSMLAVLLTKTPETVVLLLPCTTTAAPFVLLDSHPRPHAFPGAEHAYARQHDSLNRLVESLLRTFPPTDLGPDVPELMATMYNSFDLYPLVYRE